MANAKHTSPDDHETAAAQDRPQVLIVGPHQRAEFREAASWLESVATCQYARDIASCESMFAGNTSPQVIVLLQPRPQYYSQTEVEWLRRQAPLARLVALTGSWCEGELRRGQPLAGVIRVPWHSWRVVFSEHLSSLTAGNLSPWSLPYTTAMDERIASPNSSRPANHDPGNHAVKPGGSRGLVAISSLDASSAEYIADLVASAGFSAAWVDGNDTEVYRGTQLVFFDGLHASDKELARLEDLVSRFGRPAVAAFHFPRPRDLRRALLVGASAVVSKPLDHREVLAHLDELAPISGQRKPYPRDSHESAA